jgi:hypothetical protein
VKQAKITVVALGFCLIVAGHARADSLAMTAVGGVYGFIKPDMTGEGGDWNSWDTGATSSGASGESHGAAASAVVDLLGPGAGIHLVSRASAETNYSNLQANAGGWWSDVIRLAGGSSPEKISFSITVDGSFAMSRPDVEGKINSASARVGFSLVPSRPRVGVGSPPVGAGAFPGSEVAAAAQALPYPSYVIGPDGDYTRLDDNSGGFGRSFGWTKTFELQYNPSLGGYSFNLYAWAQAFAAFGSESVANFANTITITAVTNTDGSAIAGGFAFDSGFTIQAVPEPASVAMLGVGVVGVLVLARRRAA